MKKKVFWALGVVVILFAALVLGRMIHFYNQGKTDAAVAKIHATKLTLEDVMPSFATAMAGKKVTTENVAGVLSLPVRDASEYNKTIAGLDENKNGIRDDVELAIFKEYPNSAKTRAVLLQYALALQMEVTQPIVNSGTVGAFAEETSRAYLCVGKIISRKDMAIYVQEGERLRKFVEERQLNSSERQELRKKHYENLKSGEVPNLNVCDLDLATLPN